MPTLGYGDILLIGPHGYLAFEGVGLESYVFKYSMCRAISFRVMDPRKS